MLHIPIEDKDKISSQIRVTQLSVPDELDDPVVLKALAATLPEVLAAIADRERDMLIQLNKRFELGKMTQEEFTSLAQQIPSKAYAFETNKAIRSGKVPGVTVLGYDGGENLILRNFYENLFAHFMSGTPAVQIKYLALGTSYAPTNFNQPDLTNETFRKALDPSDAYDDGLSTFYASLYLKKSEANPPVTTVDSATQTTVTPDDVTNFPTVGRYQVETANNTYFFTGTLAAGVLTASAIRGGTLTNASAFPVDDIPQNGNTLTVLLAEGGFIIGNDANGSANTGKPLNRKLLETLKGPSISLALDYIYNATSIDT